LGDDSRKAFLAAIKYHQKERSLTCAFLKADSELRVPERLLQLGAFDQLIPRKVVARLSLLLSKASSKDISDDRYPFHIHRMKTSDFCMIPEHGNVGCGFIPVGMIRKLRGDYHDVNNIIAIQVRILVPSLGLFKGILTTKRGIDQIQLPPSMQKVKPSVQSSADDSSAILMINQNGTYPSVRRIQRQKDNFTAGRTFPEMARWMMVQKGISYSYLTLPNRSFEACLGVVDATNELPSDTVFLTGIQENLDLFQEDKILISRYPMTEASDGVTLFLVKEKPPSMSTSSWDFLCSLEFGAVIFGNPPPGGHALPERIAQGDLDGDEYFVCWDSKIVGDARIGDRPVLAVKKNGCAPPNPSPSKDWWLGAQDLMMDVESRTSSNRLIGSLHDMWKKNLCENKQQDAIQFGRAFKQSIDVLKHGGKVDLAKHLRGNLRYDLQRFVRPV
jgi:hypothetical protein